MSVGFRGETRVRKLFGHSPLRWRRASEGRLGEKDRTAEFHRAHRRPVRRALGQGAKEMRSEIVIRNLVVQSPADL